MERIEWSEKEREIIELIHGQDDAMLDNLKSRVKYELETGNLDMSFAFDQICREQAKRAVSRIKSL